MSNKFENKTILIVEDDAVSMEFLIESLRMKGASVVISKTGEEAIQKFKENDSIQLVLMDIRLPGIDGYKATREIRAIRPEVPIIAETAYALDGDEDKALEAGCVDYISKPIKPEKLFSILEKYL